MTNALLPNIEARFRAYAEKLSTALGHADRVEPFQAHGTGLLLPVERQGVGAGHRHDWRSDRPPEEWLLMERPEGESEPTKYWLSNLDAAVSLEELTTTEKLRWRIERDYQELKQEIGLGHFEGRGWRGFHHHATLCIAAYGFLVAERSSFPPPVLTSGQPLLIFDSCKKIVLDYQ